MLGAIYPITVHDLAKLFGTLMTTTNHLSLLQMKAIKIPLICHEKLIKNNKTIKGGHKSLSQIINGVHFQPIKLLINGQY